MYEEDFILIDKINFEIDGKKFVYKPVTAGDELDWINEYIEIIDGKAVQSFKKKTMCKLRNLLEVPYNQELINKIIKVDKEWKNLSKEERELFFNKLNPKMFDKIIKKINSIDLSENLEEKKN